MTDIQKEAATLGLICADIEILAYMGEHFDQLGPHEHSAVFASIRLMSEKVSARLEAIEVGKKEQEETKQ
ncbi:hypothetical protein R0137_11105 [Congregibacter brevis]|uniref:Phage protein n=1 Tax=Congregibacter brevis TaxID=3081201 RepID=A0ABZ0IBL8_9GAMM|nr:hypothetical protein R0137_11105 [Congregibacter sp. IMCC45268]